MQEGAPGLSRGASARVSQILLDRAFGDVNLQFEQFAPNALGSPQTIIQRHGLNQGDGLGRDFGSPRNRFRTLPPEPAERLAVPVEEGLRLDNEERLFPVTDGTREYDQEHAIALRTRWA